MKNKVLLCIFDGFGYRKETEYNAIALANTPNYDWLIKTSPSCLLDASGLSVGLPLGQMGNSEVGHLTIGAGRCVMQDLTRISYSIKNGELENHNVLKNLISEYANSDKCVHLLGIISDGGVHGHIDHIIGVAKILLKNNVKIHIHGFTDGRDTPPQSALNYIELLQKEGLKLSSISGRFFAMDRDKRYERTKAAYDAIILADAKNTYHNPIEYIDSQYNESIFDEFIEPAIMEDYQGLKSGDALISINFRSDRIRQILDAILDPDFYGFTTPVKLKNAISFKIYSQSLAPYLKELFPKIEVNNNLGESISNAGYSQLRIAETEKYAHVTYFFNSGKENTLVNEDRVLIDSPKVKTYDLKPEMSAFEITEALEEALDTKEYELIVLNYANADMVGHTGVMDAAIQAVETLDKCLSKILKLCNSHNMILCLTADHGNIEEMFDFTTNQPLTSHTLNMVPFICHGYNQNFNLKDGKLSDIAPTILDLLGIAKPMDMTGESLIRLK